MKTTTMLLAGAALLAGGIALSKRMSKADKQKIKDLLKNKFTSKLPLGLGQKLSATN